jgi:hypothetical protein
MIVPVSGGCPSAKARCLCIHAEGHDGPHACNCGGSWDANGNVITFPLGIIDPIEAMMTFMGFDEDDDD